MTGDFFILLCNALMSSFFYYYYLFVRLEGVNTFLFPTRGRIHYCDVFEVARCLFVKKFRFSFGCFYWVNSGLSQDLISVFFLRIYIDVSI
jgi:hypothetical protein